MTWLFKAALLKVQLDLISLLRSMVCIIAILDQLCLHSAESWVNDGLALHFTDLSVVES